MPQTYLFVRSNDRTLGTSSAFKVALPHAYRSVSAITLVSAELPYAFNIDSPYCLGVTFTHNSSTHAAAMQPGFYTVDSLAAWLLVDLQSAFPSAGITAVTYSTLSGRLSIMYTSGQVFGVQNSALGSLGRVFGTDPLGLQTLASAGTLTFPGVAMLAPISTLFLRIAELPSMMVATNGQTAFARLQLASAPGTVVMTNNSSGVVNTNNYATPISSLATLTCSLFTQDGEPVDLHSVNWSFTILITSA